MIEAEFVTAVVAFFTGIAPCSDSSFQAWGGRAVPFRVITLEQGVTSGHP